MGFMEILNINPVLQIKYNDFGLWVISKPKSEALYADQEFVTTHWEPVSRGENVYVKDFTLYITLINCHIPLCTATSKSACNACIVL